MLIVEPTLRIPLREIEFRFTRSSGPGGQNVNKVSSKAVLRWSVVSSPSLPEDVRQRFLERFAARVTVDGDLLITSDRTRDRERNREDCLERLRSMLTLVVTPPRKRRKTRPSRASIERRLKEKKARAEKKAKRRKPEP